MKYNALITGSNGFIGKNLYHSLKNNKNLNNVYKFSRESSESDLVEFIDKSEIIFHFAATNRSENKDDFTENNEKLTKKICAELIKSKKEKKIIFTSSIHSGSNSPYGKTKQAAENEFKKLKKNSNIKYLIYKLPGIYGKWAKPNYNSVVATFCHNILNNKSIDIHDKNIEIKLIYIDDLIEEFIRHMDIPLDQKTSMHINQSEISIGELASTLNNFNNDKYINDLNDPFKKNLLSTFQSYKKSDQLSYKLKVNSDNRGCFTEILNTKFSGQFSFLTSKPGVTRGNHFHNSKFEKFLVVSGSASFKFRDLNSGICFEKITDSSKPEIVETAPGWVHDITNIGEEDMIVLAWANENFDLNKPDTIPEDV